MCNFNYYDEFIADELFAAADAYEEAADWESYEKDMALMAANEEELRTRIEKVLILIPEDSILGATNFSIFPFKKFGSIK